MEEEYRDDLLIDDSDIDEDIALDDEEQDNNPYYMDVF